jgi:hypothetical protein
MVKGEVGILEKKTVPAIAEFLNKQFLPYCQVKLRDRPRRTTTDCDALSYQ